MVYKSLVSLEERNYLPPHISPGVIPSILTTYHGRQTPQPPPVPSSVASFPLSNAPLPTPAGWWCCPSSLRSLLARDDNDGRNVQLCSCPRVVVVLVVMLIVVLLLSVVPSCCCCHCRRCHCQTTNAQPPLPSLLAPPLPLLSQLHSLQLSPPPSPCCRFHRHCQRHGHRPRCRIDDANSLNAAITGRCHCHGHRHCCCHCRCICCSHRCHNRPCPPLSPLPQPPLTSPPALNLHRLTLGLAVMTPRQGMTPWSSRHGREVWRYRVRRGLTL